MPKLPGGLARRFALLGPSLFFVEAGVYDFVNPHFYIQLRPPYLPAYRELVYLSGVREILGGVSVLVPSSPWPTGPRGPIPPPPQPTSPECPVAPRSSQD